MIRDKERYEENIYGIFNEQQIKRELKGIHIYGCRCNERLKAKTDGSMDPIFECGSSLRVCEVEDSDPTPVEQIS